MKNKESVFHLNCSIFSDRCLSPVTEQRDDECSNASESSNSTELETVAPLSLEKARPPVGKRKRSAVSTSSSFNDNSSDDGSRLGNEIQIIKCPLLSDRLL